MSFLSISLSPRRVAIQQVFNGIANWGKSVSATIARNGDLLHRMYITITLPSVSANGTDQFRWLNWLGHIIVQQAEIEIGGQKIDKHYGHWLHIWNELHKHQVIKQVILLWLEMFLN